MQNQVVSQDNPSGSINNSKLELTGIVVSALIASAISTHPHPVIWCASDNTAAVAWVMGQHHQCHLQHFCYDCLASWGKEDASINAVFMFLVTQIASLTHCPATSSLVPGILFSCPSPPYGPKPVHQKHLSSILHLAYVGEFLQHTALRSLAITMCQPNPSLTTLCPAISDRGVVFPRG